MRIFKTKAFVRFARKEGITDAALLEAVDAADNKPDADLGGGVIKQRVARQGQGKSGGYRTIIVYRRGELAFFVYGFPKSDRGNISTVEERAFKKLAEVLLAVNGEQMDAMIKSGEVAEVLGNDK